MWRRMVRWEMLANHQVLPTRMSSLRNQKIVHSNSHHLSQGKMTQCFRSKKLTAVAVKATTTTTKSASMRMETRHPLQIHPAHNERHSHPNSSLGQVPITRTIPPCSSRKMEENDLILLRLQRIPKTTILPPPIAREKLSITTTSNHHPTFPPPPPPKKDTTCTPKFTSEENNPNKRNSNPTHHLQAQWVAMYHEIDLHSVPIPIQVLT